MLAMKRYQATMSNIVYSIMTKSSPLLHLFVTTLFLSQRVTFVSTLSSYDTKDFQEIHKLLDKINKPPVLTIESSDGDLIDCVRKKHQPAFDHPLLVNHKIRKPKTPPGMPKNTGGKERGGVDVIKKVTAWQMWHLNGTRCPKGTIPIRRSKPQDVLKAKSLSDFGKKPRSINRDGGQESPAVNLSTHEYAVMSTDKSEYKYGAKASINLWNPAVQEKDEFSLSQIWIISGSYNDSSLNTVEAGWQVFPELYDDHKTRFFIYWTRDAYNSTGCYNLLCSGFIQTNEEVALGAAMSPTSTFHGSQYDLTILIWKHRVTGDWVLQIGENTVVGYWPAELFTLLKNPAELVQWGGEIVNLRTDGKHTTTQMGSGRFPEEGFRKASYFRNLEIVKSDNKLYEALQIQKIAKTQNCYDILPSYGDNWGSYFFYGGPGRNSKCF